MLSAATDTAATVEMSSEIRLILMLPHNSNSMPWLRARSTHATSTSIGEGSDLEPLIDHNTMASSA